MAVILITISTLNLAIETALLQHGATSILLNPSFPFTQAYHRTIQPLQLTV